MKHHIVKRNPEITGKINSRSGGGERYFVQTRLNGTKPIGSNTAVGDKIYEYETGYKIWSQGEVIEAYDKPVVFQDLEGLLEHISDRSFFKNNTYWGGVVLDKVWKSIKKGEFKCLSVFECKAKMKVLKEKFVPRNAFNPRNSWMTLDDMPEKAEHGGMLLRRKIPRTMYLELFEKHNIQGDTVFYDIDHFVPASVGGPGNIEENLMPIGSGINRVKSDRIYGGLFIEAHNEENLGIEIKKEFRICKFFNSVEAKKLAEEICESVNKEFEDNETFVRDFYFRVRRYHFPNLKR